MKAVILDGSHHADDTGARLRAILATQLEARGWEVEAFVLREKKIADCAGDFLCWIRTPGICKTDDDNRTIGAAIVGSDLLVGLTPVTFGGYSSLLKRMVDHMLPNLSPFFFSEGGEIHHMKRYHTYPDLLMVGWMTSADPDAEDVFRHLVQRNAINYHAPTHVTDVIVGLPAEREMMTSAQQWLGQLEKGSSSPPVELPAGDLPRPEGPEIRRALLLVGSPKRARSTSNSLGEYLLERLREHAIQSQTIFTHFALGSAEDAQTMLDAVEEADLVALAAPLYWDSLPGCVTEALERIAMGGRARKMGDKRFTAIINCGFPEPWQNRTALAICETFARQAGLEWLNGLAVGGGAGLVHAQPLAQCGKKAEPLRRSLDIAANALAQGHPVPQPAQDLLAKPFAPAWMYRLVGNHGWKQHAKRYGTQKSLGQRPYAEKEAG